MKDIGEYLMKNYYAKYKGCLMDIVPTEEQLELMLDVCAGNTIVIRNAEIEGVGIYLTLTDETFKEIEKHDITDVNELSRMLKERGTNFHFVLLAANGIKTIMLGIEEAKRRKPKTISWWSPDRKQLHKYHLN